MKILVFDTETSGLYPRNANWETDYKSFPFIVEIAWQIYKTSEDLFSDNKLQYETRHIIKPNGLSIPKEASDVHGITQEIAEAEGLDAVSVFRHFIMDAQHCDKIAGHNIYFDISILKAHLLQLGIDKEKFVEPLDKEKRIDTMKPAGTDFMVSKGLSSKWPKLCELYDALFNEEIESAHSALWDVKATARCLFALKKEGFIN